MSNIFFASDHHLGHANILTFMRSDGVTKVRDFDSVEAMNEHIIAQHNKVVSDNDVVYFLGDVVINRRYLHLVRRMNGRKKLVMGNHDIFKNKDYYELAGFESLEAFHKFDNFVCTHIPVHSDSLGRWGVNVHGHLHTNRVRKPLHIKNGDIIYSDSADERYYCVCVEQLNDYTPISKEELESKW